MKKIIFLFFSFLLFACSDISENTMQVKGNVKGLKKGVLYLQQIQDSTLVTLDSVVINGTSSFEFQKELESPELFYLYLTKNDQNIYNDRIAFFGEPGEISIYTTLDGFEKNQKIVGSESHLQYEEFKKGLERYNEKKVDFFQAKIEALQLNNQTKIDSIDLLDSKNLKRSYAYALNFAFNHKKSPVAPYIALNYTPDANIIYLDSLSKSLDSDIQNTRYARELSDYIDAIKKSEE